MARSGMKIHFISALVKQQAPISFGVWTAVLPLHEPVGLGFNGLDKLDLAAPAGVEDHLLETRGNLALRALCPLDPDFHSAFSFVWQSSLPRASFDCCRRTSTMLFKKLSPAPRPGRTALDSLGNAKRTF